MASQTPQPTSGQGSQTGVGTSTAAQIGTTLNLDDNKAHWVIVGIAINTLVVPQLRTFVEDGMRTLYQELLTANPPINPQTHPNQHKTLGTCTLEYKNINCNDQVTAKPAKPHYNYNVGDHLDLSRLFLKPFMCLFQTFSDTDASALLSLMLNVDDSICPQPQFTKEVNGVKVVIEAAEKMRDTRNMWAHCSFHEWDAAAFTRSFQTMEDILKLVVPGADIQALLMELDGLKCNGVHLLNGELRDMAKALIQLAEALSTSTRHTQQDVDQRISQLERSIANAQNMHLMTSELCHMTRALIQLAQTLVTEVSHTKQDVEQRLSQLENALSDRSGESKLVQAMDRYSELLNEFNKEGIRSVMQAHPLSYDVSKYVQLTLCDQTQDNQEQEENLVGGLDEYFSAAQQKRSKTIMLEDLFQSHAFQTGQQTTETTLDDPRTVVIVGVPGAGKTITCYHTLERITDKQMYETHAKFAFLVKFRDVNEFQKLSFKEMLLSHHGPNITQLPVDESMFWSEFVKHEKEITIMLDGFDECEGLGANYNQQNAIPYTDLDKAQMPQVLLYNLISGNILRDAKVVLTTRPHCVDRLRRWANKVRVVNISPLDWQGVQDMVKKELEGASISMESVVEYIRENPAVQGLCSVPINAKRLLDYIRWTHRGKTSLIKDKMPQTMAGLLFVLDIKLLEALDRTIQKAEEMNPTEILKKRGILLQRLANLAYIGSVGTSIQRFTEENIQRFGLEASQLEESIMTCSRIKVEGDMGPETKRFFSFPHLTQQEHLAGLHMTQIPVEEVEELARRNQGQHDSLLSMYLGASGDCMLSKYLPQIYPGTDAQQYVEKCRQVVKTIWQSERRWKGRKVGVLYVLSMYHASGQWDMASGLRPHLYDHHGVWQLPSRMTPAEWTAVNCYLQHLPSPLPSVRTGYVSELVDNLPCTNYTGVRVCLADNEMNALQTLITHHPTLTSLWVKSNWKNVLREWPQADFRQLKCVILEDVSKPDMLDALCEPLHTAHNLDTLAVECRFENKVMSVAALCSMQALKHLHIFVPGWEVLKGHIDVRSMCKLILQGHLTWLHLEMIQLDDEQAAMLGHCVSSEDCRLHTLRLEDCGMTALGCKSVCEGLTHKVHLTALDLSGNKAGNALVTHVSHLLRLKFSIRELAIGCNDLTEIGDLCDVIKTNHSLHVLDLSSNALSATSKSRLCDVLRVNSTLLVLMMENCDLDDALLDELTASLTINKHLRVLSLRWNCALTVKSVERLIKNTHVEVLDVRWCQNLHAEDSGCRLAQALCGNSSIQVLGLGERYSDRECRSFLVKLCESYPDTGPLQALYMPWDDDASVMGAGAALADRLHIPHFVRYGEVGYDIYYDLAADTGHRWCSLPPDRHWH